MNKPFFFILLTLVFLPVSSLPGAEPVPVQIPEEELTPDVIEAPAPNPKKTSEKAFSILKNEPTKWEEAETASDQFPVVEEIPTPEPQTIIDDVPAMDSGAQSVRTSSGLIPFNPSGSTQETGDYEAGYAVTDPANFLISIFQKHQFPYAFIRAEALLENTQSQPLNNQFVQMQIPVVISFDTESFMAFQAELEAALEIISLSFQNEVGQQRPLQGRKMIREGVTLNVPDGTGNYKSYKLPKECREILAQYAALVPVGKMTFYDEKENALQNLYFPFLYRDIVKAFPINLLEVYQGEHQTIRILEHQNDPFMEFVQNEGKSFVIPKHFPVILAYSASAEFLEKLANEYYLEPVFRRPDPLPQIPIMLEMELPTIQFQNIRFINCEIMTDRPGEAVAKPGDNFIIQENSQESVLTESEVIPDSPAEKTTRKEAEPVIPLEPADEEMPFILEEIPASETN